MQGNRVWGDSLEGKHGSRTKSMINLIFFKKFIPYKNQFFIQTFDMKSINHRNQYFELVRLFIYRFLPAGFYPFPHQPLNRYFLSTCYDSSKGKKTRSISIKTVLLKVWALNQQHDNHLEAWQKCKVMGLALHILH